MGLIDDVNAGIRERVESAVDASCKVVPCTIVAVTGLGRVTIRLHGSPATYAARMMEGQAAGPGEQGYALWDPGVVNPIVFQVAGRPDMPLPLMTGVTGSAGWSVTGGMVSVHVSTAMPSTVIGGVRALVPAGSIPTWAAPTAIRYGIFSSGTVMGRLEVRADGSVIAIPLTAAGDGAVGTVTFPAGK